MKTKPSRLSRPALAFATLAAAAAFLFTACGKKDTAPSSSSASPATPASAPASAYRDPGALTLPNYATRGQELSDFTGFVLKVLAKFDPVFKAPGNEMLGVDPLPLIEGCLGPTLYDTIDRKNKSDTKTGKLRMSDLTGTRTRTGNVIRCSGEFTHTENTSFNKIGDKDTETCVLDMKANTIVVENKTISADGTLLERSVSEFILLPDKTVLAQFFSAKANPLFRDAEKLTSKVHLYRLNGEPAVYEHTGGFMKTPSLNFTYDTLVGKTSADFAAFTARHVGKGSTMTIKDGKAENVKLP